MKYCLSGLLFLGLLACHQQDEFYKRSYTQAEQVELAQSLLNGVGLHYQGSPACQMILREAQSLNPTNADVYREFGAPLVKRGFGKELHEVYASAVKYDPVGWQGWRGYLYLYFYRDYERAIQDFNATDTLTPDFVDNPQSQSVDYMRGICYLRLGKFDKALAFFDKHIAHETQQAGIDYLDGKAFLFKAIAHWEKGELEEMKKTLELGRSVDNINADLLFWLAKYYRQVGDESQAKTFMDHAQKQFLVGYHNKRPYVEEFYQLYKVDFE